MISIKQRAIRLFQARVICKSLIVKKFKTRYSGAIFGPWWAVATPLILAFSIDIIFSHIFKIDVPNFTLFALSGIIPWLFFQNTVMDVTNSFTADAAILQQGIFPREFIPISCVGANFLSFLIGLIFLLPFFLFSKPQVAKVLPFLIVIFILHLVFIIGIGLFFSTLNVFSNDLTHFLSVGLMLWFWMTPVFYSYKMMAFPYRWICLLNPLTYYTTLYRQVLYDGVVPSFDLLYASFWISVGVFAGGYEFFIKRESELLKKL